MPWRARTRTVRRRRAAALATLVIVGAALIGGFVDRSSAGSGFGLHLDEALRGELPRGLSDADGVVPAGLTVFDDEHPAVAKLDPGLLRALRGAATAAARTQITFYVSSGWRSPAYQEQLLQQAIDTYGSRREAARWVATPTTSAHVTGDAVDVGHSDATAWLSEHGAAYGLCQIYRNEPWHYELRPDAIDHGCPAMYADPAHDPRMQP